MDATTTGYPPYSPVVNRVHEFLAAHPEIRNEDIGDD
jgi:hypothetical protein